MNAKPPNRPLLVVITDGAIEHMLIRRNRPQPLYTDIEGQPTGPMAQLIAIRNWIREGRIPPTPGAAAAWLARLGAAELQSGATGEDIPPHQRPQPPLAGQPGWEEGGAAGGYEPTDRSEPCLRDYSYRWCLTLDTRRLQITTATSPVTDRSLQADRARAAVGYSANQAH